jgi:thiosulfate/3-mercaptopyruvate sulfurtransferase
VEVTHAELARRLGQVALIDVRTNAEYSGAAGYPCDPRRGHIPGARHLELGELLGCTPDELRALVGLPEGTEVVAYCHSGARSALAVEALRAAGFGARNYAGSWHQWSRDESLPAEARAGHAG